MDSSAARSVAHPVVFLDRDNTLIANDGDLGDPTAVRLLPGVADGLRRLKDAGFRLVVVTNQGGVARGKYSEEDVDAVHARIAQLVDETARGSRILDRFYYCPFHPQATVDEYRREHPWRKPQPGMLFQAAHDLALDLDLGWMIGDQPRDTNAGRAAGVRTIEVRSPSMDAMSDPSEADFVVPTFAAAVDLILARRSADTSDIARRAAARAKSQLELKPPPSMGEAEPVERRGGGAPTVARARTSRRRQEREAGGRKEDRRGAGSMRQRARDARSALDPLRRALLELVEEVRSDRTRRGELTATRVAAAIAQLGTVVCGVFALIELQDTAHFGRWLGGAILLQLTTIALLLFDRH